MNATASWLECRLEDGATVLYPAGAWRLPNAAAIRDAVAALTLKQGERCIIDGSSLGALDTAAAYILLRRLEDIGCSGTLLTARRVDPRHERLLALVRERIATPPSAARSVRLAVLDRIGAAAFAVWRLLKVHTAFIGMVALDLLALARTPSLFRPKETVSQFEAACVDAVPIVALVNFLIGVVIAYVLGVQAQRYGANIFIADGIALGVCRELSPVLASVLVAGRSGAAFTAQIGTMKVEEEIDAITTLGLSPIQVLVLPRLLALVLGLPLLVFVGDIAGIAGGMAVGVSQLDISPGVFVDRVHGALELRHFIVGLAKAPVFAVCIAIIACRMGMLVARDARSVGRNTTSTVVQCIVWVIVLDAAFAVVLQRLNI